MGDMEGQINIFDYINEESSEKKVDSYEALKQEVEQRISTIVEEKKLPPAGLVVRDNNGEKVISFSICTNEPEFPCRPEDIGKIAVLTSMVKAQRATTKKDASKIWIDISSSEYENIAPPATAEIKELMGEANDSGKRVIMDIEDKNLADYLVRLTTYNLQSYRSKTKTFACCSRFNECSDAKECVHDNKLYSTVCQYRANLEAGRIFYGKNRNVEG